jgi:hypothetical protein
VYTNHHHLRHIAELRVAELAGDAAQRAGNRSSGVRRDRAPRAGGSRRPLSVVAATYIARGSR